MGRKVLVIASFDSFMRAGWLHAQQLRENGAEIELVLLYARRNQLSEAQRRWCGITSTIRCERMSTLVTPERLARFDVLLLGLDGNRTRQFMVRFRESFRDAPKRPLTVSFYPGLLFRFHLEGMLSRMSCDVLLLNSPADHDLYRGLLAGLRVPEDNSLCVGLSTLRSQGPVVAERGGNAIVFFGQPTVPASRAERLFVLDRLIGLARSHPDTQVHLKPRHRAGETTLHRTLHHYEHLLATIRRREPVPPNFQLVYDDMEAVLADARLCLTISSTAALESVARGIPTRILADLGIRENLGNHFFLGSDLMADFEEIRPDLEVRIDPLWREQNLRAASDHSAVWIDRIDRLSERQRVLGRSLPLPNTRFLGRSEAFHRYLERGFGPDRLARYEDSRWRTLGARILGAIGSALARRFRSRPRPELRGSEVPASSWRSVPNRGPGYG